MISTRQLANALHGLGLLLRFRAEAWTFFDKSTAGFWSAYIVAVALAPLHFAHVVLQYTRTNASLSFVPYMVVEALSYIITWTLFPFAMMYLSRLLQRETRYFWHMVPYLWFQLPVALLLFVTALASDAQLIPVGVLQGVNLATIAGFAIYATFIAAVGLHIPVGMALSLVVLDFALTLLADGLIGRI